MNEYVNARELSGISAPDLDRFNARGTESRLSNAGQIPLITQYLRIALRWKWVIIGSIVGAMVLGLIATLLMTPMYTATSLVEIAREPGKIVEVEGVERENSVGDMEFYQTQYGLLRSRALAERVATDLRLVDDPAFFGRFDVEPSDTPTAAQNQPRYGAAGRDSRTRQAGRILLDYIEVSPVRSSRLVELKFTSPDAAFSAQVANAWSQHFIQSNLERRFEATAYARRFLEDRLEQLRRRLEESERLLVGYGANQRILTLAPSSTADGQPGGAERSLVADDLAALNEELSKATADRIRAQSRVTERGAPGTAYESLSNVGIAGLRQRRSELASDYAKMLVQFEADYPPALALASQVRELDRQIAGEDARVNSSITSAYQQAVAREKALESRVEALKSGLIDLKRRSIQYNIYQRDVDTNRELYDGLLQRYKEIGVAGGVGTNNVSIVDQAQVPEKPSSPRLLINLVVALLAGAVIGAAATFALEQIDEAIADPSEVEKALGVPLLGAIPQAGGSAMDELQDRKSSIVEAYLSVQTNLEFATAHGAPRSLSVTSTRPGEGKSTTSYALAHSLSRARRKVVLIDGDMRSPSVHGLFGLQNEKGLSNYLAGSDDLAALLTPAPLEGLTIMTAGPQPPNAAELLTGTRLEQLIAVLLKTHDHVVIDSPPVMGLADAPLIASKVEGTVYAVESHVIRTSLVRVAVNRLLSANAHLLGVVLTKFESKRAHFGYGYDYGYGYGQKDRRAAA